MAFKILNVVSERTARHAVSLAERIQADVEAFLSSPNGGKLDKMDIVPNPNNTGDHGRATVTVYYEPHPAKAQSKKGGK